MKKYLMLGVNSKNQRCCKLSCIIPYSGLIPSEIEASDFIHGSTNWGGRDQIERTLDITKMKLTGKKIILENPIKFSGIDSDHGQSTCWEFIVDEIHELIEADFMTDTISIDTKNKIIMAFADIANDDKAPYKYFTDQFSGEGVHSYYVFDTPKEFIEKWNEIKDQPNGMWYWVLDNGICICSGACDPDDIEIFEEHWGLSAS